MDDLISNTENKIPEINQPKKETYEPPKAEFVPLKVEERLMTCGKESGLSCAPLKFS